MNRLYQVLEKIFSSENLTVNKLSGYVKQLSDIFNFSLQSEKHYMKKKEFQLAYLFYFYPINVFKFYTLLNYHRDTFSNKKVFFDYGAGPLSFFTALALAKIEAKKLYAHDRNNEILDYGRTIISSLSNGMSSNLKLQEPSENVDVLVFGNVIAEMAKTVGEDLVLKYLQNRCQKDCVLLILEPGTHKSFHNLLDIERKLRAQGFQKLNLCPVSSCYMSENDWCHENVLFPRSRLIETIENQTCLNNKFINFCYLLMSSSKKSEFVYDEMTYRMISNLIEHKGYCAGYFCGLDGIALFELQKRDITNENNNFCLLSRGDIVKITNYKEKGGRRRITSNSSVKIAKMFALQRGER